MFPVSKTPSILQLSARAGANNLDERPAVAQADLTTLNLSLEPDLLPVTVNLGARPPGASDELIARPHGASETGLIFPNVGGVATAKDLEELVCGAVPRVKTVKNNASEAHLLTGLGGGVEGVIVAIEAVEESGTQVRLVLNNGIRLPVLRRREVLRGRALGTAPAALADVESAADDAVIDLARLGVDEVGLYVDDGSGLALVVDAEDLGADLEAAALGGGGEGLEEGHAALAVDGAGGIEFGDAGDGGGFLGGVEVDDFLGGALEGCISRTC